MVYARSPAGVKTRLSGRRDTSGDGTSVLKQFLPFTPYPYVGSEIDCPICGSANHERISRIDRKLKRLPTDLCLDCGLFFTNPMPADDELDAYYRNSYRLEYQLAKIRPTKKHVRKKRREAEHRFAAIQSVSDVGGGASTLDFGCGSGELVHYLASQGCDAHGFEPGSDFGAFAKDSLGESNGARATIQTATWREVSYPAESFDVITCLHVLEHLNRPIEALGKISQWLKPGGVTYLEVPNMQGYYLKGFENFHFAHVLGFSRGNLMRAASSVGFKLLTELNATSLLLVKADDPRGRDFDYDLAETVRRNQDEYGRGITFGDYLRYHRLRAVRLLWGADRN